MQKPLNPSCASRRLLPSLLPLTLPLSRLGLPGLQLLKRVPHPLLVRHSLRRLPVGTLACARRRRVIPLLRLLLLLVRMSNRRPPLRRLLGMLLVLLVLAWLVLLLLLLTLLLLLLLSSCWPLPGHRPRRPVRRGIHHLGLARVVPLTLPLPLPARLGLLRRLRLTQLGRERARVGPAAGVHLAQVGLDQRGRVRRRLRALLRRLLLLLLHGRRPRPTAVPVRTAARTRARARV